MGKADDLNHAFPRLIDENASAGKVSEIVGRDGVVRDKLEIPGSVNGKDGVFEYIKDPDGSINHRFFRETR